MCQRNAVLKLGYCFVVVGGIYHAEPGRSHFQAEFAEHTTYLWGVSIM